MIDKRLQGWGNNEETKYLKDMADLFKQAGSKKTKVASETPAEETELDFSTTLSEFPDWKKKNPTKTFDDFLEEKGLKRVRMKKGGLSLDLDIY